MFRRWALVVAAAALVAVACKDPGGRPTSPPPSPVTGFPSSMVALGDSITAGFGSCLAPTPCLRNSWSTGDGALVSSHYRRIAAANPAMRGHARNLAVPGAMAADLPGQASAAASHAEDYVTILIGANDACRGGVTNMTPPERFRESVDTALATLGQAMPEALILVAAIPDIYRVWEVGHTNRVAVAAWRSGVCANLLANPTSTAAADVARRQAVRDEVAAYNSQLEAACRSYGAHCRYGRGSATFAFSITMLSAIDFFHPNSSGQNALAGVTYPGSFDW
jgi:lysophospholipase L1-like esterase